MNKSFKYTILTLLLALGFAFGSMAGMNLILEAREKQILTERGKAVIEAPVRAWQEQKSGENEESKGNTLTLKQISDAIDSWNNRIGEMIHDPVEGQISMEQAIEQGKVWLASMEKNRDMGEKVDLDNEIYSVSAVLGVGKQNEQAGGQIEPYYSFWTIQFTSQGINTTVYLNAVTGKVWGAEIILYEDIPTEMPVESMYLFAELTGVEKTDLEEPKVSVAGNGAVMELNEGIEAQMNFSIVELDKNSIVDYSESGIFQETYAVISYKLAAN